MKAYLMEKGKMAVYFTCTDRQLRALHREVEHAFNAVVDAVETTDQEHKSYLLSRARRSLVLLHLVIQGIGPEEHIAEETE